MKENRKLVLLEIGGGAVAVKTRVNPRAKRLIVKVHPSTGEIAVVAPTAKALGSALDFARGQRDWIAERLSRVPAPLALEPGCRVPLHGREHIVRHAAGVTRAAIAHDGLRPVIRVGGRPEQAARKVENFLKRAARAALSARVQEFSARLGAKARRIALRDSSSRWGSCSSRGTLSFSWRLVFAPAFVLDYVVAHEVSHLRAMNHGKRFWACVDRLVPDKARAQAWLRENGPALHRYRGKARKSG